MPSSGPNSWPPVSLQSAPHLLLQSESGRLALLGKPGPEQVRSRYSGNWLFFWHAMPDPGRVERLVLILVPNCNRPGLNGEVAVMRWSNFVPPCVVGAFMAVQSYAASRTWGVANPNTIAIVALSVISTLFLLGLAIRGD